MPPRSLHYLLTHLQGILVIIMCIVFRDEVGIPNLYGIKETDMNYYLYFALVQLGFKVGMAL